MTDKQHVSWVFDVRLCDDSRAATIAVECWHMQYVVSRVVTWEGGGRTAPGDTIPGWHPNEKNVAELRKNTGQPTSEGGSCDETTAEKRHLFAEGDD